MDHDQVEEAIRERLREACRGRSLRRIADETGFNHETVRRYLKGESGIPASFVEAVRQCTGVPAAWLLCGADNLTEVPKDRLSCLEGIEVKARAVSQMIAQLSPSGGGASIIAS